MDIERHLNDKIRTLRTELKQARHSLQMIELERKATDQEIWDYAILRQCTEAMVNTCLNMRTAYLVVTLGIPEL